jgi:uncharacterized protein (TIGR03083 family)
MGDMQPPLNLLPLIKELDTLLLELLESLRPEEWHAQTVAKKWRVKDVVAHLLDGNIRSISMLRDGYFAEKPSGESPQDLIDFLNGLNADWVQAMKRVSPPMLVSLHRLTGPQYIEHLADLPPWGEAGFSVAWAGQSKSYNWMHIAREYSEKWLHQQQIREAVHRPALMERKYFYPFMDTFMLALPYTFRTVEAPEGVTVVVEITGNIGGKWAVKRKNGEWVLWQPTSELSDARISLPPHIAWKLFSKSIRPHQVISEVQISGVNSLARHALEMISVMA